MIQVALVGYGYWGPNLARCLVASGRARLTAICDGSPERAAAARSAHPGALVYGGIEAVLRDPAIDAVVLATPTGTHGHLAARALESGKHVLVEKPLAASSVEAAGMAAVSERHGLVLMVDHTYLFSPAFEVIQRLIADRGLGPLRYYHSIRANCFGPGHETSVLWDLAVHDLSILDALMSSPPSLIQAAGLRNASGRPEAHAQLTLTYPDRAFASVLVSWIAPAKVRTILLGFDRHTIAWDDLVAGASVQLFDRGLEATPDPGDRRQPHSVVENIPVAPAEPLANAVRHFLDCVERGTSPRSSAASGVRTVRWLEAAQLSLVRNGEPAPVEVGAFVA